MATMPNFATTAGPSMSEGERRALRTIKVFISLGFQGELLFLIIGLILFPDNGPLVWRLVWTLGLCGIGMGAAVGGITYLIGHRFRPGTRAAYLVTALSAAAAYSVCQTLCWSLDHNVGLNYWGSIDMPELFLIKGYTAAILGGVTGSFLLNSDLGTRLLDRARM
ncbi:hypothetical protein AB0H49_05875 [Nocardia sp. NPDC050713]|uniref:hypothetical protein n=1 Tax=Nocardia sp. NPDC050713 TaxID=3154511 RepID=UPI0033D5A750